MLVLGHLAYLCLKATSFLEDSQKKELTRKHFSFRIARPCSLIVGVGQERASFNVRSIFIQLKCNIYAAPTPT